MLHSCTQTHGYTLTAMVAHPASCYTEHAMAVSVHLPPETEKKLREHARASGKDVNDIVAQAVEEKLASSTSKDNGDLPATEWSRQWRAWAASHRTLDHIADDSRESVYNGRGE